MAKTNIGRVSIVPAGEYSSLIEYKRLTAVSYQGNMYISRTDCLGIEPTNEDYWFKAVDKGAKGDKGDKGDTGKDFSIYKTYPSISAMEADINNVPEGSFVMIASDVEDEDNSKLYVKSETSFVYITDMSGATGMKGDKGDKGDKPVKGVDYFTQEDIDSMVSEITDDANSVFNQNVTSKTNTFNTNATEKTNSFNSNYTEKLNNINNAQTTAISNINNASTTAVSNVESAEDTAINNIETAEESAISDINTAKNGAIEEINSQDNVGRIDDLEKASEINKKNIDILIENFDKEISEGTKIDLENTAEAPMEVVEIAGNTTQDTREGYNLLKNELTSKNINGVTVTVYDDGSFSLDGTSTGAITLVYTSKSIKLLGDYVFYLYGKMTGINLQGVEDSSTVSYILSSNNSEYFSKNYSEETELTQVFSYIANGTTFSNNIFKPMISKGTEIKKFQQYGAMPSLEYESEVVGVTGNTETSLKNKNQLSLEDVAETTYVEAQEQLHTFSLGDLILYGNENARDYFNITIDQDFYEKTGYRKITNLDLVKKWKKIILDGIEFNFIMKSDSILNNVFFSETITNILAPQNNNVIIKIYSNYFAYNTYVNNLILNNIVGFGVAKDSRIQFGFGLESDINTLELANAKLQELNTAGNPLYIVYQLSEAETETITDQTLISEIENFINNSYTYKQTTSINSDFYLKLNYRKNMYYDLENRVKALEQANTPSSTPSNTPE